MSDCVVGMPDVQDSDGGQDGGGEERGQPVSFLMPAVLSGIVQTRWLGALAALPAKRSGMFRQQNKKPSISSSVECCHQKYNLIVSTGFF